MPERTDFDLTCKEARKKGNEMVTSVKQMTEAANAAVPRITPQQAREMIVKGDTLVVDVRDAPEVEKSGKVAGAVHRDEANRTLRGGIWLLPVTVLRGCIGVGSKAAKDKVSPV